MLRLSLIPVILLILVINTACGSKSENNEVNDIYGNIDTISAAQKRDSLIIVEGDTVIIDEGLIETNGSQVKTSNSNRYIIVDKNNLKLYVIEGSDTLFRSSICAGRNLGNKKKKNDLRTPEGDFKITAIHDASGWLYHTDDGRYVPHVYGPWFLRLDADGWDGIGIHGTNAPGQIGKRRSKGCIRMRNADIQKVHDFAFVGMEVKIIPDKIKEEPRIINQESIKELNDTVKNADKISNDIATDKAEEKDTLEVVKPEPVITQPEEPEDHKTEIGD